MEVLKHWLMVLAILFTLAVSFVVTVSLTGLVGFVLYPVILLVVGTLYNTLTTLNTTTKE